jgi:hypothetical protein
LKMILRFHYRGVGVYIFIPLALYIIYYISCDYILYTIRLYIIYHVRTIVVVTGILYIIISGIRKGAYRVKICAFVGLFAFVYVG